ncbi:urea ABC transporter ATP-binding subunit UrtE [Ethanoligenens harbinense]|uniref:Urea ABC transporter, ATP-binding protein UrtE n=1 Tax=Ethanoligenens harbinense (strain DSM 18485 / JCM 12961 / CGMCC 1.5033 / YUAN-3) TaxID=663278 RepID=E6U4V9_ETHHY|nr:urea ABC transporter ATP-binding subunit UrtE [Ethanoligenens harbinense]ADU27844.1 urea ABC transporter, ATP-binding protein UrtE [Ethanoligenens harbinense YUAN-3]AVQ96866.1 urea ABC transporter ATP-binding subunit UrtE [Ethanoligenens harbinense YUAN-3]AYF39528.1 urea ABC transporter ATP-binding subunit UrtE [Ethanoligenens harbinense]AYF42353.1 urea ABC transporter ATP-binding subunit UrtE [Ethanoligenens harbinense]QCN93107.1 urea ABC transporter ATP-binding subunit UrtE [Ethanoligenen
MLVIDDINVNYGKSKVINGISMKIGDREKLAILGRNGVGKTTLLKSVIGLLPLEKGRIRLDDKEISRQSPHWRAQQGIAYVPQGREIIPDLTVEENLELGGYAHTKDLEEQKKKVLRFFPALEVHLKRKGGVLSGGQQQQLAIGRALMSNPKILLLDEPTEGIQPNIVAEIAKILDRVREEMSITLVIVEQNLKFARKIADHYVIIQKGKVVSEGEMAHLEEETIKKYLAV